MQRVVNDIQFNYEEIGSGRPVLMLHGSPLDHHHMVSDMEPMFDQREGWRRLYVDLPGHGRTPGSPAIKSCDDFLDYIVAFMDDIAPNERFSIMSVSFGGYFARGLVYKRSAFIDGVMMAVPSVTFDPDKIRPEPHQVLHEDPAFLALLGPDDGLIANMAVVQDPALAMLIRDSSELTVKADVAFLDTIDPAYSFDVDAPAEPCPAPALIITGRQDSVVGYRLQYALLDNYPRATFAVLDRAGHLLGFDQQVLFRALINEWLDRVEEYAAQRAKT